MTNPAQPEPTVWVRRQWNDWRRALYRLADLEDVHWTDLSGGTRAPAPRYFLHGYVWCDGMLEGELAHSGMHGQCPHHVKVCVIKKDNQPATIRRLMEQAGPEPRQRPE